MSRLALPPLRSPRLILALATFCEALSMTFDLILGAIVTIGLLVYLVKDTP
jgi:hypothetical protein